ncbi:MAG: extracellular solute-binding protein [Herbinix sp.]|jgi:putative aldouronate transport system substrate-binding protein|nr:extracellular solute-binding protein [Herbinix sp.]
MKKRFTFIARIVLCLVLISAMLVSCSPKSEGDSGNDSDGGSQNSSGKLDPVTLHFIFFGDKKAETDAVWDAIAEYTKDTLNATFDVQFIAGNDYKDKILVKGSTGDVWDLNFDGDWLSYYQMVGKDAYMVLDDLLPEYAPTLYAKYQESGAIEAAKSKGHIVAVPWTMVMNNRPLFQWRGDLVEEAGITVDKDSFETVEDIDALLAQMKEKYPDKKIVENCGFDMFRAKYNLMDIGHSLSVDLNDPELKVIPIESTQAYLERAQWAEKWQDAGYMWKDILTDKLDHNDLINQGLLISKFGTHEFANQNRAWVEEGARWDYAYVYEDGLFANRTPLANVVAISATSENPERTLMFLNMLEEDQKLYDMVHYGIEGKTYVLNGEEAVFPEGMNASNSNYMEWGGRWALWKPQFMRPDASYSEGFWTREKEAAVGNPKNVVSPLEGFSFDITAVNTEVSRRDQIYTDADKLLDVGLGDGTAEEVVQKLIEDQKAAGLDIIVAEAQKQIDEFLKGKK